jgi:phosphoglycerate kinase
VFVLGGLKISDGFSIMGRVLGDGIADRVLTTGVVGEIMLMADGVDLGEPTAGFISDRDLGRFVAAAAGLLGDHRDRLAVPVDVAVVDDGERHDLAVGDLPTDHLIVDIGVETIGRYRDAIASAGTVFVNGPPGAYETPGADLGTRQLWEALAATPATTVIGGGDTVASARRFIDPSRLDHVSTGGGALIRHIAGQPLPLIEAFGG